MEHEEIKAPRGAIWLANAFAFYLEKAGEAIEFIHDQFRELKTSEDYSTPQQVRDYAESIRHRDPSLAQDLIAAANRAEEEK